MEDIEFQKLWKTFEIIALGCVLLGILLVLYLIRGLLTPFIVGFVITFFLSPVIDYMEGEGINRTLAVVLLLLLTLILLFLLWKLAWPTIQTELSSFQKNAPSYASKTRENLDQAVRIVEKRLGFIPESVMQKAIQQKISDFTSKTGDVGSLIRIVREFVVTFILIQVVVFFLLKDGRKIRKMLIAFVPNKYFETFLTLLYEIDQQISNYIRGQLTDAFSVGILVTIGLYLFGIKYAIFIGAVVGIANIIPYIGPFFGFIFGGLLVFIDTGSPIDVLKVEGVIAFVKVLDNVAITPLVIGRSVNVHPLMVMIVVSFGGLLHGVWGMLLSVPLYCSMRVSFRILYRGFVEYGNW